MYGSTTCIQITAAFVGLLVVVYGQSKVTQSEDGQSGTISFSTPDLNDDDAHSPWMPTQLKCDACKAIAFQYFEIFSKFNDRHKHYKTNIPESEILDLSDEACDQETYSGYGLTSVGGENRLKGKGLETEDTPGIMQGGGKWPTRLQDQCMQYMGEVDEIEIYKHFKKNPKSRKHFENYLCRGEDILGQCARLEAVQMEEEKKRKEEERLRKEEEERKNPKKKKKKKAKKPVKKIVDDDDDDEDDDDDDDDWDKDEL